MKLKICSKCGSKKDSPQFHKSKREKDGLHCHCKVYRTEYGILNKIRINKLSREWLKNNREYAKEQQKQKRGAEGYCVYKATFPSGVYIGSGLVVGRRANHLNGHSGIATTLGEKATEFEVLLIGEKEYCREIEYKLISNIPKEQLLNTKRKMEHYEL